MSTSVADAASLARAYAADPTAWPTAPRFNPEHRWYSRLHADAGHEAWLLTWLTGQGTDIHDHGGAAGAFVVVSGQVSEEVFGDPDAPRPGTTEHGVGTVRAFGAHHIHRVHNAGLTPAVTLHVYTPGLTVMSQYAYTGERLELLRTDREGVDW